MTPITSAGFQLDATGKFAARHLEATKDERHLEAKPESSPLTMKAESPSLTMGPTHTSTPNAAHAAPGAPKSKVDPKLEKVAHEFEAIFLRNLLKPLENAGSFGKQASVSSGSSVYGSMMTGALADSASQGGGIGLSQLVLEALTRGESGQKTSK